MHKVFVKINLNTIIYGQEEIINILTNVQNLVDTYKSVKIGHFYFLM